MPKQLLLLKPPTFCKKMFTLMLAINMVTSKRPHEITTIMNTISNQSSVLPKFPNVLH